MTERDRNAIEATARQVSGEIELLRREAADQGLAFSALSEEELIAKEAGETSNSPYIYAQSWTSGTTSGSSATYRVYVRNPDPRGYYPLLVTIFFGLANFVGDIGHSPASRHDEWPYLSSATFSLGSSASTNRSFTYQVPQTAAGTYTGNAVLWRGQYHDAGDYLDRGLFPVSVS